MPVMPNPIDATKNPVLASFSTYAEAQKAVDTLSDNKFAVDKLAIVGVDLRTIENVLGRMSWGRAAGGGALTGAWFGLLLGLFVGIIATTDTDVWPLVGLGLIYGTAFGIVFGLVSYAMTRGQRDFISRQSLQALRYDVHCDASAIEEARRILGTSTPAS